MAAERRAFGRLKSNDNLSPLSAVRGGDADLSGERLPLSHANQRVADHRAVHIVGRDLALVDEYPLLTLLNPLKGLLFGVTDSGPSGSR